jgi:glycerol uptake facilitator-like aquaporin
MPHPLTRRLLAEYLGSAFLAAVVIGSGIAAQQLSDDTGLRLLENAAATAAGLFAIILMLGPVSGGHFNPVVSLVDAAFGGLSRRDVFAYIPVQIAGCVTGAVVANAMFALSAISVGRIFSDTFAGIAPASVPAFVIAQLIGGMIAYAAIRTPYPDVGPTIAAEVVVPHDTTAEGA